ncbi:MAG: hypothetical protein M3Q30_18295 [Actinomycetota bacterium]|nr:hypothetical protein [Actinomycetota bacterium]
MNKPARKPTRRPREVIEPSPPAIPGVIQIGGLVVPAHSRGIEWTDPSTKVPLLVDLEWSIVDGRAEPVRVTIYSRDGDKSVTAEMVRRVPVGKIVAAARAARLAYWERENAIYYPSETDAQRDNVARAAEVHRADGGLSEVAEVYRAARVRGESVQRAVAAKFNLSPSGAAKRIARARARGYLGEAIGTRAGERQPEGDER